MRPYCTRVSSSSAPFTGKARVAGMLLVLVAILAIAPARPAAAQDRFDNFRMRKAVPTQLKQVAPDLYP